jgi:hypothetical protein
VNGRLVGRRSNLRPPVQSRGRIKDSSGHELALEDHHPAASQIPNHPIHLEPGLEIDVLTGTNLELRLFPYLPLPIGVHNDSTSASATTDSSARP